MALGAVEHVRRSQRVARTGRVDAPDRSGPDVKVVMHISQVTDEAAAADPGPIEVAVLPSPPLIQAGLAVLLGEHADRVVLAPTGTPADVLVVDLAHVDDGPVEVPDVQAPLVAIVNRRDTRTVALTRRNGATPVPTTTDSAQLVAAIEAADRGSSPRPLSDVDASLARGAEREKTLSPREKQVVGLICTGASNRDIATDLFLSPNSVKTYVRTAYRKMGVSSRSQAVLWGLHQGYDSD